MNNDSISVVIPSRRRPEFLTEALTYVGKQSRKPDEIIVVFDQEAPDRILSPHAIPLRIKVTGGGFGASASRNFGAKMATSVWLAFLDDDDWWLPSYLETVLTAANSRHANIVCTSFLASIDRQLEPEKLAPINLADADFFSSNPGLRGSNLFIKKEIFNAVGGFDEKLLAFNDVDFGIRLAQLDRLNYIGIEQRLVVIRKHSGLRISGSGSAVIADAIKLFYRRYKQDMSPEQKTAFLQRIKRYWNMELSHDDL